MYNLGKVKSDFYYNEKRLQEKYFTRTNFQLSWPSKEKSAHYIDPNNKTNKIIYTDKNVYIAIKKIHAHRYYYKIIYLNIYLIKLCFSVVLH